MKSLELNKVLATFQALRGRRSSMEESLGRKNKLVVLAATCPPRQKFGDHESPRTSMVQATHFSCATPSKLQQPVGRRRTYDPSPP